MIVIDTKDGIAFFQYLSIRGRLQIEISTGLRSRVSTLAAAQRLGMAVSRTKKGALGEVEAFIKGMQYAKGVITEAEATSFRPRNARNKAAFERGFDRYHELARTPGYVPQ